MRRRVLGLLGRLVSGPWTPLKLTGMTFGIMVIAVAVTGGERLYSYVDQDPTFCRSCHTMEKAWVKWQTSEHSKITCHSCHESNPVESMEQVVKFAMNRPTEVRKHARVNDEACEKCHASNDDKWIQIAETAGHKVHFEEQRLACVKCHGVTVHRFAAPTDICLNCHGSQKVKMTEMAQRYCLDCHNYLAEANGKETEGSGLKPTRQTCLSCHENANAKVHWPTDAPMVFQCQQCHQPHKQVAPEVNCKACHQDIQTVGLHAKASHANTSCTTCHKPHEWKVTARESCTSCHANKVEHNNGQVCITCHTYNKPKSTT